MSGCLETQVSPTETQVSPTETEQYTKIEIKSFAFNPASMAVSNGTTIAWIQLDGAPHTVTSVTGIVLDSPVLSKGQSYNYTFNKTGTFEYYCKIHPYMKGSIIVI